MSALVAAFVIIDGFQVEEQENIQAIIPETEEQVNSQLTNPQTSDATEEEVEQIEEQQPAQETSTTPTETTEENEEQTEKQETPQEPTPPVDDPEESQSTNSTTPESPEEEEDVDLCGNAVGNGYEIVHGQVAPNDWNPDNAFRSLTVHPNDPDTVLFGTEANGFVITRDGGQTWERLRMGLRHMEAGGEVLYPEIYDVAFSESNPNIIYAATLGGPGPLTGDYPSSIGGIYKSTDGGQTWSRKNCGLDNGWIFSIHVSEDNPDNALIGVSGGAITFSSQDLEVGHYFDGGIFKTTNGGENWTRINVGINDEKNAYSMIKAAKSNQSLVFTFGMNMENLTENVGFLKSSDGGSTWESFAPSLKHHNICYFDVSSEGNVIYAIANDVSKIFKSVDGGDTWKEYNIYSSGYGIVMSPSNPDKILFGKSDGLYLSTNGLRTNFKINEIGTSIMGFGHVCDIVFAPSDNDIVYMISLGYNVYKSTDSGERFTKIANLREDVLDIIP